MSTPRYIKTNNLRLSWAECWHLGRRFLPRLVLLGAKIFRVRMQLGTGIPLTETARECLVAAEEVPHDLRDALAQPIARLESLGFHTPQYSIPRQSLLRGISAANAILVHPSGEMFAMAAVTKSELVQPPLVRTFTLFETVLAGGGALATTTNRREMDPLPGDDVRYLPGCPAEAALQQHLQRLGEARAKGRLQTIRTADELWSVQDENHRRTVAERLQRGVWELLEEGEVSALRARNAQPPPLPGDVDGPVMDELEKLQQPRRGWGNAALLFVASLALFLGFGAMQWQWEFALMLVPVLLFHEFGHYLAMRIFGYQNLRIFFIPFFGAAVSGLRLNAPAWQQAVVALAGPVPGLIVGWALQAMAASSGNFWLEQLGRLCLVVNAFNLLPLLPLDGGRVLDALVYVRNRWLEAAAFAGAALGLMALSHFGSGRLLFYLGLFMLFGLPHTWRIARVSSQLRRKGFVPDSEQSEAVSREAAAAILAEARQTLPRPLPPKALAQTVLAVYRRLHTRPPGLLGSVCILAVYAGTIVLGASLVLAPLRARWEEQRLLRKLEMQMPSPAPNPARL